MTRQSNQTILVRPGLWPRETGTPVPPASSTFRLLCSAVFALLLVLPSHAQQSTPSSVSADASTPAPAASSTQMTGQAMLYPGEDFQLSPGDLISVRVFLQPDYQATVRVDSDGNVKLPFIGSVNLKSLSVRDAQALIAGRLQSQGFYQNPEVIIQVMDTVNGSVLITGEMHQIVPVSTERSLKDVLLTAGGLPANASHTVKIVRAGLADPIVIELGTDLASSKAANIAVRPHDIIQISRASVVYVIGAFAHQGAVPLDQASPLTLLQLAALSGGIGFEGRFDDLRLIRTVESDQGVFTRKVIEVDIKKVRNGQASDPVLQANDIVFLPTNAMKAIIKSIGSGGIVGIASLIISARAF
jgi:polysaccharide export outer membrane protein